MDDLERYVEGLFAGHRETRATRELKSEIRSNLEARLADYIEEGLPYEQALARAKRSLENVDELLPDRQPVYINSLRVELVQAALLHAVIAWVLTIPLRFSPAGIVVNTLLLALAIGLGIPFLILSSRRGEIDLGAVAPVDQRRMARYGKTAWLVWLLYLAVSTAFTSVKHFGSAIWFGRPLHIDGPYQFALLAATYALPLVTVILPLLFNQARALAEKHEVEP